MSQLRIFSYLAQSKSLEGNNCRTPERSRSRDKEEAHGDSSRRCYDLKISNSIATMMRRSGISADMSDARRRAGLAEGLPSVAQGTVRSHAPSGEPTA